MAKAPASFAVLLTQGAARDLASIYRYIADSDGPDRAAELLQRLLSTVDSLSRLPERGSVPQELITLGIKAYRQILCKPYRLIYRVIGNQVFIYLIVDGRRDMQSALMRRLLVS